MKRGRKKEDDARAQEPGPPGESLSDDFQSWKGDAKDSRKKKDNTVKQLYSNKKLIKKKKEEGRKNLPSPLSPPSYLLQMLLIA